MAKILLTSENFVKGYTNISDNLAAGYLGPAIRETQDVDLTEILGSALVDKLCELVSAGTIDEPENAIYKEVLSHSQFVMAYGAIAKVIPITAVKIDNFGPSQSNDDNIRPVSISDISTIIGWYTRKFESYSRDLMRYVLSVKEQIPELDECSCNRIKAHLNSAAASGLFLGGPRGRRLK